MAQPPFQPRERLYLPSNCDSDCSNYPNSQIFLPAAYQDLGHSQDQSQRPLFVSPTHAARFAPGTVIGEDGIEGADELQWNYALESRKRLKEQDFLENTPQLSSLDLVQSRSVSTGLGLSLENSRMASAGNSSLFSLIGDDIDLELQRQDAEVEKFLKVQGDRLRQTVLAKVQSTQLETFSLVEGRILQKLREKEAKVEIISKRNIELQEQVEQLAVEADAWQQQARYNESMIAALKFNLQQVCAQNRDSREGCGDSEVNDTASCCNGRSTDFHLLCKGNNDVDLMTCRACRTNAVCMLLLPCKHLCLCKDCESKLSFCPLCQSSKFIGMEVYM